QEAIDVYAPEHGTLIPGSYIVTLKSDFGAGMRTLSGYKARQIAVKEAMNEMVKRVGLKEGNVTRTYSANSLMGFAIDNIDASIASEIAGMPEVAAVEQNRVVALAPPDWWCAIFPFWPGCDDGGPGPDPDQTTPWGITRVGGATDFSNSSKKAWVIDTGIDFDHPDLNVNTSLSRSFVGSNGNDGNGHGTHVAGTIGAIDNSIGVIGVAAGVEVVAVQVLGATGGGSFAGVISGIDYVAQTASPGDVANLSLGGPTSAAVDAAIANLGAAGVFVSLAAGNESQNANNVSPARTNGPNIYTVSAMTSSDFLASFSNFANPPVDFAAPGQGIESTWLNGGYNTISGTSMAAPHVAGLLLVTNGNLSSDGVISGDRDNIPDPIAHK
ncbi:MAG: S8 family serine peptidase, partial [Bacteroidota bacterium]